MAKTNIQLAQKRVTKALDLFATAKADIEDANDLLKQEIFSNEEEIRLRSERNQEANDALNRNVTLVNKLSEFVV